MIAITQGVRFQNIEVLLSSKTKMQYEEYGSRK